MGMTKPLVEHLRARGVRMVENVILTRLLLSDGVVVGAVGYDSQNDGPVVFSARAVVGVYTDSFLVSGSI